jgi:hypothetical protein
LPKKLKFTQFTPDEPAMEAKINEKLCKLIEHGYLEPGLITRLLSFFAVAKAETDIRVVWDGKKNGLNDTIYTPSFQLLTAALYHRVVEPYMEPGDFDFSEMFPNYMLHPTK